MIKLIKLEQIIDEEFERSLYFTERESEIAERRRGDLVEDIADAVAKYLKENNIEAEK